MMKTAVLYGTSARKVAIEFRRYIFDTLSGIVTIYGFFLILFFGARVFGGDRPGFGDTLSGVIVSYALWALTMFALGSLTYDLTQEAQLGTLEQLMVTPASPVAVVLGKLLPYLVLAFFQLGFILLVMRFVFDVPVNGSLPLLIAMAGVYLLALLSLGLLVSSWARTQMEAIQIAQMFLLPSIMLSGYIFPLSSLPDPLRWISHLLPAIVLQ